MCLKIHFATVRLKKNWALLSMFVLFTSTRQCNGVAFFFLAADAFSIFDLKFTNFGPVLNQVPLFPKCNLNNNKWCKCCDQSHADIFATITVASQLCFVSFLLGTFCLVFTVCSSTIHRHYLFFMVSLF